MVDCVDSESGKPPPELKLAWMCGDHHLPDAGGVLDQDYRLLYRMRVFNNVYNTMSRLRGMKGAEIHSLTHNERMTLRWLRDLGLLYR